MYNQIVVFKNNKNLVEALDLIPDYKKIKLNIIDYSAGVGDKKVSASANIDIDVAGVVFGAYILQNNFSTCQKVSGKDNAFVLLNEQKLLSKATPDKDGRVPMNICQIFYDGSMNYKYAIIIENGMAIPEKVETGGFKAKKGSYVKTSQAKKYLSVQEMQRLAWAIIKRIDAHIIYEAFKEIPQMSKTQTRTSA